jgi:hypothetical protein
MLVIWLCFPIVKIKLRTYVSYWLRERCALHINRQVCYVPTTSFWSFPRPLFRMMIPRTLFVLKHDSWHRSPFDQHNIPFSAILTSFSSRGVSYLSNSDLWVILLAAVGRSPPILRFSTVYPRHTGSTITSVPHIT